MVVLPTSRAVRDTLYRYKDQIPPKVITFSELLSRVVNVQNYRFISDDGRQEILHQQTTIANFHKLHIPNDFFAFLSNSEYLFKFFEELKAEKVSLDDLKVYDTYAEFSEHIDILLHLLNVYEEALLAQGYIDKITMYDHYTFNDIYIQSLETVNIVVEGFLTAFEFDVIDHIAKFCDVTLTFHANRFNEKMIERLNHYAFELTQGFVYKLQWRDRKILSKKEQNIFPKIQLYALQERLSQVAWIELQIDKMVRQGIDPASIVVIVPDETFVLVIQQFKQTNNLNFAMGYDIRSSVYVQLLETLSHYHQEKTQENEARLTSLDETMQKFITITMAHFTDEMPFLEFCEWIERSLVFENEARVKKLLQEKKDQFILNAQLLHKKPFEHYFHIWLRYLYEATLDDINGGKVTVMGVLESRAMQFDGVIVIDFNDDKVPRHSQKDLFLNSEIRRLVGLPTSADRQSLQLNYYYRLFEQAKCVHIAFVDDDLSRLSTFMDHFEHPKPIRYVASGLNELLFPHAKLPYYHDQVFILEYDLTAKPLSASKLTTLLTCKRKFYYRYIAKIEEHQRPTRAVAPNEIGSIIHTVLQESMIKGERLHESIADGLDKHLSYSAEARMIAREWKVRLEAFEAIEKAHSSWKTVHLEKEFSRQYRGFNLVGRVDRVVEENGEVWVLDYKTGKVSVASTPSQIEKMNDFQLIFYYLFFEQSVEKVHVAYYDLLEGQIVEDHWVDEKLARLNEVLDWFFVNKTIDFEKCESYDACRFCGYAPLCDRG
jgi:CRISPR/Cas system-associated exonuclease Cas4 (RecB family)